MNALDAVVADLTGVRDRMAARLAGVATLEEAAQRFARGLVELTPAAVALARVYATVPFIELPPAERAWIAAHSGGTPPAIRAGTPVLSLLGTAGADPAWNDRTRSAGHRAIPLLDSAQVDGIPMIARLLAELGIEVVVRPGGSVLSRRMLGGLNGVFFVEDAATAVDGRGRRVIPADAFVRDHRIKTVFGMGGHYLDGTLVCAIVFTRETLMRPMAESVATLISQLKIETERLVSARRIFA